MSNLLQEIQQLQFSDRSAAEALLVDFIRNTFQLDIIQVEIRPLAVSLNSFNGFVTLADGKQLFFKTHTESDNVIGEYYRAGELANAGYRIIQPVYSSTEAGKHLLMYDLITEPSVFDVAWHIETEQAKDLSAITYAQNLADDELFALYLKTLQTQTASEAADAPIHQLFYHRLAGGRMERFYGVDSDLNYVNDVSLVSPTNPQKNILFSSLASATWEINGQQYRQTIKDLIQNALELLNPYQSGPSIIGHGDAHNGNVFWLKGSAPSELLYFDPAFAGRHHPLLDLAKPIFHNVFAMWMYFPLEIQKKTHIEFQLDGNKCQLRYDNQLPPIRQMFLSSKISRVLKPIAQRLHAQDQLRDDWRQYLKSALFCCPFLTMNLADNKRFPPEIALLGFAMAVEMGANSYGKQSILDTLLDEIEESIQ